MTPRPQRRADPAATRTAVAELAARPRPPEHLAVHVPRGHRVAVVGGLDLRAERTPSSDAAATDLAEVLRRWEGPGVAVVSGDVVAPDLLGADRRRALEGAPGLREAVAGFTAAGCRLVVVAPAAGRGREEEAVLAGWGAEVCPSLDLVVQTAEGDRRVAVRAGQRAPRARATDPGPGRARWLAGMDRLDDPEAAPRFVASRTTYRRLARYSWAVLVPAVAAALLRVGWVVGVLGRLAGPTGDSRRALTNAYGADWPDRALATILLTACVCGVLLLAHAAVTRRAWPARAGAAGAGRIEEPDASSGLSIGGGDALDAARALVAGGACGVVVGGSMRAELIDLDAGFVAFPGALGHVVREHRGRLGLPPVFVPHAQDGRVELRADGALCARMVLGDALAPGATRTERLCAAGAPRRRTEPSVVASWPGGAAWPPPPAGSDHRATRRVRRAAAVTISLAGAVDLLEAVRPPGPGHLRAVEQFLSLGDIQAARALMALAGVLLVLLARGLLRGQRRAWALAAGMLTATMVLRVAAGALVSGVALSAVLLTYLLVQRRRFEAAIDHRSWRSAVGAVAAGGVLAVAGAFVAVELTHVHRAGLPAWPRVLGAVVERLVGLQTIALPARVDAWVGPSLLAVGCTLGSVALFLATRPVVDRRLTSGSDGAARWLAERRAWDIVRRHGSGSLDYFALRDDKHWFFHRDTLVAYAVHGGVCLVSPDPIGPVSERVQAWSAFRRFADRHGWAIGVVGASEAWLPVFRASGMRHAYIGDEAIVDVQGFSLAGNRMKGLRQACTRVERKGYRVETGPPSAFPDATRGALRALAGANRRGGQERGFSMTLGRLFDERDDDLLLTVVSEPQGRPVALCQFVPARGIGGYSLDLMRRDTGEHPNGLLDYALCAAIAHLRAGGHRGLSLNFAALRATLDGVAGTGVAQRVERWALRRLSSIFQIESLWRFNAKYEPTWQPRYVVFDCAEHFVPTVLTIMRAESLSELPVLGRLLTLGDRRSARPALAAQPGGVGEVPPAPSHRRTSSVSAPSAGGASR